MKKYILGIDQGTTGSSVAIIDSNGKILNFANQEFAQVYPKPGWVEHDPELIWKSLILAIRKLFKASKVKPSQIHSIGITNQRETCLVWNKKTGKSVYNAIVWQCRRTTDVCEKLKKNGSSRTVIKRSGLLVDPYFSASKISWILKHKKVKFKTGEYIAGTIDSYII